MVLGFTARRISLGGLVAFLVCVVVEHGVNPSLDPATHQVSEYARTSSGAVMTVGFLAWAVSLAALALVLFRLGRVRLLTCLIALAAAGLVLVASFGTQTVAGELPHGASLSTGGRLHDIGSGLTTVALLAAAIASAASRRAPAAFRRRTATLIFIAILGGVLMLAIGASVGGARQRLLILIACCWQYLLLQLLARNGDPDRCARS
jgi:MFS family permease